MVQPNVEIESPADAAEAVTISLMRLIRSLKRTNPAPAGVPDMAQATVLHTVLLHQPVRLSELTAALYLDASTVSRHVSTLEERGLLTRAQDPDDRRATLISLTETGGDLLHRHLQDRYRQLSALIDDWTDDELRTFNLLLTRLAGRLDDELGAGGCPLSPADLRDRRDNGGERSA